MNVEHIKATCGLERPKWNQGFRVTEHCPCW